MIKTRRLAYPLGRISVNFEAPDSEQSHLRRSNLPTNPQHAILIGNAPWRLQSISLHSIKKVGSRPMSPPVMPPPETGTRAGKRTLAGHYSEELSKTLNKMAVDENSSVQALLGVTYRFAYA